MKIIIGRLKAGDRGFYRITYNSGYKYVGSFVNSKNHIIGETYFGSSSLAKFLGWRKSNCQENKEYNRSKIRLLEVWYYDGNKENQLRIESRLIRLSWYTYGVARYIRDISGHEINGYKEGLMLNCHNNACLHLSNKEIREKVVKSTDFHKLRERVHEKYGCDPLQTKQAISKRIETRRNTTGFFSEYAKSRLLEKIKSRSDEEIQESIKRLNTEEARRKSIETRRKNGYSRGAEKVAKTISGREHFCSKSVTCRLVGESEDLIFESIKDAEEYFNSLGVHITRATISQGLLRTKGNYNYKNKIVFSYLI